MLAPAPALSMAHAALLNQDIFRVVAVFQPGLPADFVHLQSLQLPSSSSFLDPDSYSTLRKTLGPWHATHTTGRVAKLLAARPNLHNILYVHALYSGLRDVLKTLARPVGLSTRHLWDVAAFGGHVASLAFLHKTFSSQSLQSSALLWATRNGHLESVQFLAAIHAPRSADAVDCAAGMGRLELLEAMSSFPATPRAMDEAAKAGHLHIVKFLHRTRSEGCTVSAMDWAAANGHLNVVQFLHDHRAEGCSTYAMDAAAANGHLDVVQWLHDHRVEGATTRALDWAAWNGHLEVVKFLHCSRNEGGTPKALELAARGGFVNVVEFLDQLQLRGSAKCMAFAARFGHLDVVKYLWTRRRHEASWQCAVDEAVASNHGHVVEFLTQARQLEAALDV